MRTKFILYPQDSQVLGIMQDDNKDIVIIGGPVKSYQWMMMIITQIFDKNMPGPTFTAKNKMRYKFKCTKKEFDEKMNNISDLGSFNVVKANTFGRLMR